MHKNKAILKSIQNAFSGIGSLIKSENNSKIHLTATILVLVLAIFLNLPIIHWVFLIFATFIVWITEAINTSIEYMFDLIQPEIDPKVKIGKDISAGAVLLSSILSVIIGLLILGPPLINLIQLFVK